MQKKLLSSKAFFEWNITKVVACKEWKKKSNIIIFAEEKYHIGFVLVNFSPQYFVDAAPTSLLLFSWFWDLCLKY